MTGILLNEHIATEGAVVFRFAVLGLLTGSSDGHALGDRDLGGVCPVNGRRIGLGRRRGKFSDDWRNFFDSD
jgi:hypothetical protein